MKQKVFDYIEELERKAKESEKYFKLWHEEKIKNNNAIEYINKHTNNGMFELRSDTNEIEELLNILKGDDKE